MKSSTYEEVSSETPDTTEMLIMRSLTKLDKIALGISIGIYLGLGIFIATNFLILKGGEEIGPNLVLLSQYFAGYDITFVGSLIGLFYGFISGFALGWLIALLRNAAIRIYISFLKFKGNMSTVNDFIDNP